MTARIRLGCMGWQEKDWRGPLYPEGMKPPEMLGYYARGFSTVEVDSTFYGRPREGTVQLWAETVPDDFRFALKVSREVTHRRRFREAEQVFALFVERVRGLGAKLGPILLQCPRDFKPTLANRKNLFTFLECELPQDVKVGLELRNEAWFDDELFALARNVGIALVAAESEFSPIELAARILYAQGDSPNFAYVRWMGATELEHYDRVQVDKTESLERWSRLIDEVRPRLKEIYGYVSDDYSGHSPATVRDLLARLGEPPVADRVNAAAPGIERP